MSTWEEKFHARMVAVLLREGQPVAVKPTMYRQLADDWRDLLKHLGECPADTAKCSWHDEEWTEFDGTFADPPWGTRQGIALMVTCSCGTIAGRQWRCHLTRGDLLRRLTEENRDGSR